MYSKQELSRLKQEFWTRFGQYMKPVPFASGEKMNWSNYKTGVPHIFFRMQAEREGAYIGIELSHPDQRARMHQFEQFKSIKPMLQDATGEAWSWESSAVNEHHKTIARIYTTLPGVDICAEVDWPQIISFLKPRVIALDTFWADVKMMFE
jgi:hypothetical protein